MKLPVLNVEKVKRDLKAGINNLATGGFQQIFKHIDQLGIKKGVDSMGIDKFVNPHTVYAFFKHIDQLGIKKGVDSMGIDKFVNQCALMAAGSGVITGIGGLGTALIGTPVDVINLITQQFRVTLAISYHNTGRYSIRFEDFFKIVASSVKADTKLAISKNIMEEVAEKILMGIGSKAARRLVPVVGAVIGGTVNYLFIKKVAEEVKVA